MKSTNLKKRLYLIAVIILLVGMGGSVLIYMRAEDYSSNVLGYEMAGGYAYPIRPEDSKIYRHDLELYGGKAGVLADDFRRWFKGLWHGKSFAYTVACISAIISLGVFFIARTTRHNK
ncbi:MAG TPA: hypothetical protein VN328_09520 [Thermodesulfovibrionales bacterium]|nr:hypothetical protein [Thermodesulfovibrionales bacterium]